jgi:glucokinase
MRFLGSGMMKDMIIVFDIGGTNMRVAGVEDGVLGEVVKVPTPKDPEEGMVKFVEIAKEIVGDVKIEAVAGDIAGRVGSDGRISGARNLQAWKGTNIVQKLTDAFGVPAQVVNDCEAAGLGEALYGAGKGAGVLVYITVSTGVGGARIDHGVIDFAANDAFIIPRVQVSGEDIERLISGTAVHAKFGIEPKELGSIDERNKLADILAQGLLQIIREWKPDTIVLGGSMITGVNPIPLGRVIDTLSSLMQKPPVITMAALGDNGGLYGGMILAQQA